MNENQENAELQEVLSKDYNESGFFESISLKKAAAEIEEDEKDEENKNLRKALYNFYPPNHFSPSFEIKTFKQLPANYYTVDHTNDGLFFNAVPLNTDILLRLPDSRSEDIINEVEYFWKEETKEAFKKYGFLYKRGFLLWGPAGSGKSCTIDLITEEMIKRDGIVIKATTPHLLIKGLQEIRNIEPKRNIVVTWEDIDEVVAQNGEADVLNVLDGNCQIDNIVFLATTNHPERLGARIVNRPSRFDRVVKIGMPNKESRKMYLLSKTSSTILKYRDKDAIKELDLIEETEGFSFAHMRELLVATICQGQQPRRVIERLRSMFEIIKTDDSEEFNKNEIGLGKSRYSLRK